MNKFLLKGVLVAGVAALLAVGSVGVFAQQGDKLAAVKARQDFMKAQGADAKAISDFSKGQGDQAAATKAAEDLVARQPKIPALLVPGTSTTDFPDESKAKPELWTDTAKVQAILAALKTEEDKLVTVVKSGDKQAIADQLTATNKAGCGACHGAYRINKT
ncbi:MAG TPA: cytochrome c [Stellaceae bacterium]|jgi:cytochrome c556